MITTTLNSVETTPVLHLTLRVRPDTRTSIEQLQKILEEFSSWTDDFLSEEIRTWSAKTIHLLSDKDENDRLNLLKERVEILRKEILFDQIDSSPLINAHLATPSLVASREILDDWMIAAEMAGEPCPIKNPARHDLACAVIDWAQDFPTKQTSSGSIQAIKTDNPKIAKLKHLTYLIRSKNAATLQLQKLLIKDYKDKAALARKDAEKWREKAKEVEEERLKASQEHSEWIERGITRLQTIMDSSVHIKQSELDQNQREQIRQENRLEQARAAVKGSEEQILRLQNELRSLKN